MSAWSTGVIDRSDFACGGGAAAAAHYGKVVKPTSVLMVSLKTALINMDSLRRLRALAVREFNELAVLRKEDRLWRIKIRPFRDLPSRSERPPNRYGPTFNGRPCAYASRS